MPITDMFKLAIPNGEKHTPDGRERSDLNAILISLSSLVDTQILFDPPGTHTLYRMMPWPTLFVAQKSMVWSRGSPV